jgi:hypothetical protein
MAPLREARPQQRAKQQPKSGGGKPSKEQKSDRKR